MTKECIIRTQAPEHVVRLTLQREEALNALSPDLLASLLQELEKLQREGLPRVVIITGAGEKAFVAGADIRAMSSLGPRAIADYVELGQRVMRTIECYPVPVIAEVNGYALGGGLELALACDLIITIPEAKFGQPEVQLGILPGFGATQRLQQRVGIGHTRRLIYTGDLISGDEALQIGLADIIVPKNELTQKTAELAANIAAKAPLAVQASKVAIRRFEEQALCAGLRGEVEAFLSLFGTSDREEGMQAFLQKRKASFTGR